jgi:hypothetical protein
VYNFLLIEDAKDDIDSCIVTEKRMKLQNPSLELDITVRDNFEEGIAELEKIYDGVIVDINLDGENSGNEIIKRIIKQYRIPVAVMTGTPDTDLDEKSPIMVYTKGEVTYEHIINSLIKMCDTGMFDVIGGRGKIIEAMNTIFWNNLYPQIHLWQDKKEKGVDTEEILLRYAVAHIQELVDAEIPAYVTEEMYINPPLTKNIRTGSILKSKENEALYIVLSPPCDLVLHSDKMKTDRIMLCEIIKDKPILEKAIGNASTPHKKAKAISKLLKNTDAEYFHWLPSNALFIGGYINFRNILTFHPDELKDRFHESEVRIQEHFVKNILRRFSSFYARQGQPDFNFEKEAEYIVHRLEQTVN